MLIGIPREPQTLVSATPDTVGKLIKLGYDVAVQSGAGDKANFPDSQFEAVGATIVGEDVWSSDIVTTLDTPTADQRGALKSGATLISRLAPGRNDELVRELAEKNVTAIAMDTVPRISRAQSMDVLSSQANIAGYRAVIEAANTFGRLFTGQVTAAGKVPPATVYVIGTGVAGLAAIGTANSMGAVVKATDLRPETAEQVESMGAEFVAIPTASEKSDDGYAKEMTQDQAAAAAKLYAEQSAASDIVITTANIPGRTSPVLLTAADVAKMKPGSVIVDMAAANGGNCELTVAGEVTTTDNGVKIIGYTDLAGRLPAQSSQLYGQNVVNLFKLVTPGKDGQTVLDLDDEIVRGITVTKAQDGAHAAQDAQAEILWPPPPVKVSAAPAPAPKAEAAPAAEEEAPAKSTLPWKILAGILGIALVLVSPLEVADEYMVLLLAVVVGFYVITAVTHKLHTPLMSETNAISGIILVGAILQVGSSNIAVAVLAFIAIVVASINIFGGFFVTRRMLTMFEGGN
ncbi:MAG: Re/Si-specific NAD(P)(+) transhydrogenase subunit alpha [Corynebacterium sp.]|uniref:Re/Si-specific NAD(P)(+) transhydrogenase subunit alpha n=1 Tax=unclassified Corynebacterium TaxID=2624378 RepID=UPI002649AB55|nr:Re/Si-specific NAD(P)(+) transhydrogenase subunit alpha [Corynebacterium sp.]MDN5581085.1 Re/Si-specific NAD(P)(+) transhydrogenase subunit alpha [Corynebacterium sp.]MDN5720936.1 Re/Si-specific NAD(P)(+) transhydrogenase subunit alpha [Corynebacterium sp.]MDN6258824.1 Re/Si-specific NAD(P)(+) transhydrogenase subunit alpha [Corynebacterium sp.]